MVGVNIGIADLANLVGDTSAIVGPWKNDTPMTQGPYYSLLYFTVAGGSPATVSRYRAGSGKYVLPDGTYLDVPGIGEPLRIARGKAETYLNSTSAVHLMFTNINQSAGTSRETGMGITRQDTNDPSWTSNYP